MGKGLSGLRRALKNYNRGMHGWRLEKAGKERQLILEHFPLGEWERLPLENYAIGQESIENTLCYLLEFRTLNLGSIRGGSARKLLIYKHKDKPGWYHDTVYPDEQVAWEDIRGAFVRAFQLAKAGDFDGIDDLDVLHGGPALLLKVLHVYFPGDILPIYSRSHLEHFWALIDGADSKPPRGTVSFNTGLLKCLEAVPELVDWSPIEIMYFLYYWADPRDRKVVKIAPGRDAKYWEDCLTGEYICVGWDAVGDLRKFESQEAFRQRFFKIYGSRYNHNKGHLTKKANELWTLMELAPGDLVVANRGISKVLAVGEVMEPGYEWMPDRERYRHVVHIRWDEGYAQDIAAQKQWAFVTVAPLKTGLYQKIISKSKVAPVITPPFFRAMENALKYKGQLILYGPPGTGKTYQARRFAVWWLLQQDMDNGSDPAAVLADAGLFDAAEQGLSTVQVCERVWWMVANGKEWHWNNLQPDGRVEFRYGRLKRNYPLLQVGDLVVGYQATPDKRVMALARVARGLTRTGTKAGIEVEGLASIPQGLTWGELRVDPILKHSEPIRFRNQGTLFALTMDEAEHLVARLTEMDPNLEKVLETQDAVGPLTRLTFHPSYSYEDFVEGFRPVDTGTGTLQLRLEDGVFKRVCREALINPDRRYVVLVDEINRAHVAKVFGELITILEKDKRGMVVTLPQSKESFLVPPNVYMIGTMNTADRSIKLLDAALRRRFAFIEVGPDLELLRGAKVGGLPLDDFLEELNRRVVQYEGREKRIGHAYLLNDGEPVTEPEELARRLQQEVLPLLQEYCYDDYARLAEYLGPSLVDMDSQALKAGLVDNADLLLEALETEFVKSGKE